MFYDRLRQELTQLQSDGLFKSERALSSAQSAQITVDAASPRAMVNLCSNNYLGLANDPRLIAAAKAALDSHGLGLASVRFICGTQDLHLSLEAELSQFLGTEDSILFASCFDANGAVFEPLFGPEDAIVSDQLNHASIIDGIRLSKARRYRFRNRDMAALEESLRKADAEAAAKEAAERAEQERIENAEECGVVDEDQYLVGLSDRAGFFGKENEENENANKQAKPAMNPAGKRKKLREPSKSKTILGSAVSNEQLNLVDTASIRLGRESGEKNFT